MLEEFLDLIGYYLIFILLCLVIGFSVFFVFSRKENRQLKKIIASRIGLSFISSRLGLNLFDASELADQFHAGIDSPEDLYSKSLVLAGGTAELNTASLKPAQNKQRELSWEVFPEAFLLKTSQKLFLGADFVRLGELLSSYRASKPINAFVLTLCFEDLLDEDKIDLIARQLPRFRDFVYPIYLILRDGKSNLQDDPDAAAEEGYGSGSEKELFAGLRKILSAEELSRTVGWSDNPLDDFDVSKYFLPNVDETIASILKHIVVGLKEIIYAKLATFQHTNAQELILLLEKLPKTLEPGLKQLILSGFTSKRHYFLRGIYLSDGKNFLANLFFKSIFAEDLSNSVYQSKFSLHSLLFLRASIFISVASAFYLFFLNRLLVKKAEKAEFAVEKIGYLLKRSERQFEGAVLEFDSELQNARGNLPRLLPWSMFSGLKSRLYALFALTYNRLVLNKAFKSCNLLTKDLAQGKTKYTQVKSENPFFRAEQFTDLMRYVSEVARVEEIESELAEISRGSGMLNLASAIKKLFSWELPGSLANNRKLYKAAFDYRLMSLDKTANHAINLQENLSKKIAAFCELVANPSGLVQELELLSKNARFVLQASSGYSLVDLNQLKNSIEVVIKVFSDIKFLFETEMPKDVQNLLNSMSKCLIFSKNSPSELNNGFTQAVEKLRSRLLETNLPIFGRVFSKNDQLVKLEPSFVNCLEIIREFFQKSLELPWAATSFAVRLSPESPYSALLDPGQEGSRIPGLDSSIREAEWNLEQLTLLVSKISEFEAFLASSLEKIPASSKIYMGSILKQVFSKSIEQRLFESLSHKKSLYLDEQPTVDKMNKAISFILQIIAFLRKEGQTELVKKLSSIVAAQIDHILEKLYERTKNIYAVSMNQIGQKSMTDKQISSYLASNRSKLKNSHSTVKELINHGSFFEEFSGVEIGSIKKWESIQELLEESNGVIGAFEASLVKVMSGEPLPELPRNEFVASQLQGGLKLSSIKMRRVSQEELQTLYPLIQARFYSNLAGFFPFAPFDQPDLPLERMKDFVVFWSEYEGSINNILRNMAWTEQHEDKRQWYVFLQQMSLAVQWMRHFMDPEKYPASVELTPMAAKNLEKNSAELISLRVLLSGESLFAAQSFEEARMEIGSELKSPYAGHSRLDFAMQLASQSRFIFQRPSMYPKFMGASYKGAFSLLRFLQANFYQTDDRGTIYLLIQQPIVANEKNLELAVSIGVRLAGLEYTTFPRSCPDMSTN